MHETLLRRFSEKNIKAWGMPDLIVIDGGKGQLEAALKAMDERGVRVPTISIAKREEEILIHNQRSHITAEALDNLQKLTKPGVGVIVESVFTVLNLHLGQRNAGAHSRNLGGGVSLSPYSDVTKLFQRIRDESHRFAVSYHTVLKRQRQTASLLSEIPGIGPQTQKKLIKAFGSLRALQTADQVEMAKIVGQAKAALIKAVLET